jgi:hypothetical protein
MRRRPLLHYITLCTLHYIALPGPIRGGFSRYIGPGPESQEEACESLKGPVALAIDVLFRFFYISFWVFSTISSIKYMLSGHSAAQEIKHL